MRVVVSSLMSGIAGVVVAACLVASTTAMAAPRSRPPKAAPTKAGAAAGKAGAKGPTQAQLDELAQLDKEYMDLLSKQANFAAVKVGRKALALQIKMTGPDSVETQRRKQSL